jgi:hypothetical protein
MVTRNQKFGIWIIGIGPSGHVHLLTGGNLGSRTKMQSRRIKARLKGLGISRTLNFFLNPDTIFFPNAKNTYKRNQNR